LLAELKVLDFHVAPFAFPNIRLQVVYANGGAYLRRKGDIRHQSVSDLYPQFFGAIKSRNLSA
jgi:hypothetical protein